MINSAKLHVLTESETNKRNKRIAESLLMAINDWPKTNLSEPEELITELKLAINGTLTFENISNYMSGLNTLTDSWRLEALSSILEIFDNSNIEGDIELEAIINRLSERNN